jgi:cyclic pyranopterin monophosphate synthase
MTDARLTHTDETGAAHMVDVGEKAITRREARAEGFVGMNASTLDLIRDNAAAKGDVLGVARVAGIMAAKRTWELIPLCHAIPLSSVEVRFTLEQSVSGVRIDSVARTEARTGVEMEALTAASVAALTIYDMVKAVDRDVTITDLRLTYKSGGRSGTYSRDDRG